MAQSGNRDKGASRRHKQIIDYKSASKTQTSILMANKQTGHQTDEQTGGMRAIPTDSSASKAQGHHRQTNRADETRQTKSTDTNAADNVTRQPADKTARPAGKQASRQEGRAGPLQGKGASLLTAGGQRGVVAAALCVSLATWHSSRQVPREVPNNRPRSPRV